MPQISECFERIKEKHCFSITTSTYGTNLKIFLPILMFQRPRISLGLVKSGISSKRLKNQNRQLVYSLDGAEKMLRDVVYNNGCNIYELEK